MDSGKRNQRRFFILYSLIQILYWGSGFATMGFAAAYLGSKGFSNGTIGLIVSLAGLANFALTLGLSVVIDRTGSGTLYKVIGCILAAQLALTGVLYLTGAGAVTAVLYTLFLAMGQVMQSLFSKMYMDLSRRGAEIDFGKARALGSLAYAGCSFAIGWLASRQTDMYVHVITAALYALLLAAIILMRSMSRELPEEAEKAPDERAEHSPVNARAFISEYRYFLLLVLGISLVTAANRMLSTFLVRVVAELGGSTASFTSISGLLALIEIPVMFFFTQLRKKHSLSSMLLVSLLLYAVKLGGAAAAQSLTELFAAVAAQIFAAGLFHPASVEFIRETIPHGDTAKCQAILDGAPVFMSFVTVFGFGSMLDYMPARRVCLLLFFLALAGTALAWAMMGRTRRSSGSPGQN